MLHRMRPRLYTAHKNPQETDKKGFHCQKNSGSVQWKDSEIIHRMLTSYQIWLTTNQKTPLLWEVNVLLQVC